GFYPHRVRWALVAPASRCHQRRGHTLRPPLAERCRTRIVRGHGYISSLVLETTRVSIHFSRSHSLYLTERLALTNGGPPPWSRSRSNVRSLSLRADAASRCVNKRRCISISCA